MSENFADRVAAPFNPGASVQRTFAAAEAGGRQEAGYIDTVRLDVDVGVDILTGR
jgi:hypothetical protein